ncbi:MAG: efflux RND transporter permease subunit [Elusimicrobia bacterium]|nr:efflux RND transporter permease subunit [Elusimicrobiota bacterium]
MIDFFLNRRVLTNLITFFVVGVGGYQACHVRREAFPDITFDIITITTVYPGASPEEVESLVTRNVERELKQVSGIDRVESFSVEGRSLVVLRLDEDLSDRDSQRVVNEIYQAMSRVKDLPEEVDRPLVQELTSSARPLITLSVAGADDDARDRFADELKDILEELPGIARVDAEGAREREIWIEVDPEKLKRHDIMLAELSAAVRGRVRDASAGTMEVGPQEKLVRVVGAAMNAEDIAQVVVRASDERSYLRVSDVAQVRETFEEARVLTRASGLPAINLNVAKLKSGDAIDLADAVKRVRDQHEARARSMGMTLSISDDISFFIKRRLKVMTNNMIQGGVLILAALFLFLDWRLAVVAAWGVPISFAAAMMVAVPFGFTINLLSLLGFIIVLGMLDDDSVVVAENIYRHLELGKTPAKAAVDGAREVVLPVVGSVLVSSCAFLPFALMEGIMGKFMFMLPVIVCMAFLASAFEAFFILPSHVMDILPLGRPVSEKSPARWYEEVSGRYESVIRGLLQHKGRFLAVVAAFLLVTVGLAWWRLRLVLFPPGLIDQFFIQVDMPEGSSLGRTESVVSSVEKAVLELPVSELDVVTATVGRKGIEETVRLGTHFGQVRVFLTPEETRARKTSEIMAELRQRLQGLSGPAKVTFEELRPGPPVGRAVQVRVRGRDMATLGSIADRIKSELSAMDGVRDIVDSREGGKDQIVITPDAREAAFARVDTFSIARTAMLAIDGAEAAEIRRPDEEVKVRVRLRQGAQDAERLLELEVPNPQGRPVPIGRVARIERRQGPPFIAHYNFRPVVTVTADVNVDKITSHEANGRLARVMADVPQKYPGYELIFGGEEEETIKSLRSLLKAFGVALGLDFVILATLFRSYIQPLIILTTVPIGLLGVVYALLLHGQPASFMALLGVVAMTGVVVNNAIVLVDFINSKRAEGMPLVEAAVKAGSQRLRPIAASSITTLLGLFPTAYGFGGYEPFVAPMALSLAWGLTIAMPMTLFLIPAAYVFLEDLLGRGR